ncbi:hypothetical protein KNP414_04242 [Paenibacillus mucilaginosus KNP414]|uniref:Uncharacterized protein n=1 Tax=Paenibacillus mucilaginosus (strain KNP414) TaxID=1036673 RepID=F8FHR7_PAEMK|nr:hypothetical protein KNP414_04242 [Paenibacillus mucilaginosus KNP414]
MPFDHSALITSWPLNAAAQLKAISNSLHAYEMNEIHNVSLTSKKIIL